MIEDKLIAMCADNTIQILVGLPRKLRTIYGGVARTAIGIGCASHIVHTFAQFQQKAVDSLS